MSLIRTTKRPMSIKMLNVVPIGHHARTARCPTAPAQIPAWGYLTPGSSKILTSALQVQATGAARRVSKQLGDLPRPPPRQRWCQAGLGLLPGS
jgi:hypothetical protein